MPVAAEEIHLKEAVPAVQVVRVEVVRVEEE
jgi:hypothetical protein